MGQLFFFLWIVWSTHALLAVKIRWYIYIGLFMPYVHTSALLQMTSRKGKENALTKTRRACLAAVISRLLILPANLFADDWTFALINAALLIIAEVLFSVMKLLAPSLPVLFDQDSTGGLHFVPGNTSRTAQFSSSSPSQKLDSVDERQVKRARKERRRDEAR